MPRELPNAQRQEQSVLGSIMIYPEVWQDCMDAGLSAEDFFHPAHVLIYQAMGSLHDQGKTITETSIVQKLQDVNQLEQAGGIDYVLMLQDGAYSSATAKQFIETIQEKAQIRRLISVSEQITEEAMTSMDSLDQILDQAEKKIMDVTRIRRGSEFETSQMIVDRVLEELRYLKENSGVTGLKTGFIDLDSMTNGLQRGDLIILAARPAMGKSAFALNLASQVAKRNEGAVAIFSLEMPSDSMMKRMMSCESAVKADKLRNGQLSLEEMNKLYEAGSALSERKIFLDDTSTIRVSQIFSKCRKLKSLHGSLSLVVIDYLQLISGSGKGDSRQQEVSEISRNLKILAKEMECPVIALSQLSRKVEERTDHEPMLSDLRESGSIEQDADIVMFLYREAYYDKEKQKENSEVEVVDLSLAKHRNGSIGKISLVFEKSFSRFQNCTNAVEL